MTVSRTPVLLAGATGMLGERTAHALLDTGRAEVRLLVRPAASEHEKRRVTLEALVSRGAQVVEGDLADPRSLLEATRGVEVIVSAVQGGRDVIVDGQLALVDAAVRNGVRRVLPSDFAVDLFSIPPERHAFLGIRREADEAIAKASIEHVHVLNGAFMEMMLNPFMGLIDADAGEGRFWGGGDELIDLTSVEDTARFTAAAALDRSLPSGKFAVAGEVTTFRRVVEAVARATGHSLNPRSLGTVEELADWISAKETAGEPVTNYVSGQYLWAMVSGVGKLSDLQNGRYPDVQPESFEDYLSRTLPDAPQG